MCWARKCDLGPERHRERCDVLRKLKKSICPHDGKGSRGKCLCFVDVKVCNTFNLSLIRKWQLSLDRTRSTWISLFDLFTLAEKQTSVRFLESDLNLKHIMSNHNCNQKPDRNHLWSHSFIKGESFTFQIVWCCFYSMLVKMGGGKHADLWMIVRELLVWRNVIDVWLFCSFDCLSLQQPWSNSCQLGFLVKESLQHFFHLSRWTCTQVSSEFY